MTSPNTGWWVCSEMPRSPDRARISQFRYWIGIGLSNPYARLIISMSALLASAGIIDWIGSPGARYTSAKQTIDTPIAIGITSTMRRAM